MPQSRKLYGHTILLLACMLLSLLHSGCKTTSQTGSKVTATAILHGYTPARILSVTKDVFVSHGYKAQPALGMSLTFEKEGGALSFLLYGDWMERVWLRAKVSVSDLGDGNCSLDCNAKYVRGKGDEFMEDEQSPLNGSAFRKMFKEVHDRLAIPDPAYPVNP